MKIEERLRELKTELHTGKINIVQFATQLEALFSEYFK